MSAAAPSAAALLADPTTVAALHRVHGLLDAACQLAGDLDLVATAVLADVAACGERGLSARAVGRAYGFCQVGHGPGGVVHLQRALAERELVTLVRSAEDRRALAFRATTKGIERSALVDRAMGARLVEAFPGLSEESFDQLVDLFYGYARAAGRPEAAIGLFPGPVLCRLAAFWHGVVAMAARFGMTSLQVVLLMGACAQRPGMSLVSGLEALSLPERFLAVQREALRDRGFLREDDGAGCTEAGAQRVADFTARLGAVLGEAWEARPPHERAALGKLLQYALYLFS